MKMYICYLLTLGLTTQMSAQQLIESELIRSYSKISLDIALVFLGGNFFVDSGVDVYRVEYTTSGVDNLPDTASGLFLIPQDKSTSLPLHCHMHGTTNGRTVAPSNLEGGFELGLPYAGLGQFVVVPDFLGMGVSRGFHPYIHRKTEATASIDMLLAAKQFAEKNNITVSNKLIIAGYSQGGHAAMALQNELETSGSTDFELFVSTPMSGPYDLSGAFKEKLIDQEEEYFYPGYLAYVILAYQQQYMNLYDDINQLVKAPYIEPILNFQKTGENLDNLHDQLIDLLMKNEGKVIPIKMLKDEYFNDFISNDNNNLHLALEDNNTYNFETQIPTRLIYCTADDQVPYQNSINAEIILKSNGSTQVSSIDISPDSDHGGCIAPALNESIRFINNYLQNTSTIDTEKLQSTVKIYPNPTANILHFEFNHEKSSIKHVSFYNVNGLLVEHFDKVENNFLLLNDVPTGTYAMRILTRNGEIWKKIIKQ